MNRSACRGAVYGCLIELVGAALIVLAAILIYFGH